MIAATEVSCASIAEVVHPNDVHVERVEWLLPGRIPFGEVTIVEGIGGIGKTTAILDLLARASLGRTMPDGTPATFCRSLIIASEDSLSTLKARLVAASADLDQIRFVRSLQDGTLLTLPTHMALLEDLVRVEICPRIVFFDSLFSCFDRGLNANASADVRSVLEPLSVLAHESGAAIIAIRHWRKSAGDAISRGLGSVEVRNVARSVITVGRHPHRDGILVAIASKSNLGAPTKVGLLYSIESASVPTSDGQDTVSVGRIEWQGTEAIDPDDLTFSTDNTEESTSARDAAVDFLGNILANGELRSDEVYESAKAAGIASSTLKRAARRAKVIITSKGFPRRTYWELPDQSVQVPRYYGPTGPTEPTDDSSPVGPVSSHILPSRARELNGATPSSPSSATDWGAK